MLFYCPVKGLKAKAVGQPMASMVLFILFTLFFYPPFFDHLSIDQVKSYCAMRGTLGSRGIMNNSEKSLNSPYLIEVSWEVCNQIGGIYTVLRSKVKSTLSKWRDSYILVGPYFKEQANICFERSSNGTEERSVIGKIVKKLREEGYEAYLGRWLVAGRPKVVLLNPRSLYHELDKIKYFFWESHHISCDGSSSLIDDALCFGKFLQLFITKFLDKKKPSKKLLLHFHEWMAATAIADIRRSKLDLGCIFTTHATTIARFLAMHDPNFYRNLPQYDWEYEAKRLGIETQARLERAAAHGCHVFTTVSRVTARECKYLLGRKPDAILPNGLNIEKFTALHEFQNLHLKFKKIIHEFVAGHFFPSYTFNLDKTVYFFTSGRFEFRNKGFDLTLEALRRLNHKMRCENIDKTVVMFFITQKSNLGVSANVLGKRALMSEIKRNCSEIERQIGEKLFAEIVSSIDGKLPDINYFVDEYLQLRLRRIFQRWKTHELPGITTHNLYDSDHDEIINHLKQHRLLNLSDDKVKIVYHADFISPSSSLLPMEYDQFVRGCHLGIFTSFYEPWGYTPLESIANGIPAVTTDLTGFGDFVKKHRIGKIFVLNRSSRSFEESADELANYLIEFVKLTRRQRIDLRNKVDNISMQFDWSKMRKYYDDAYQLALTTCFKT